MKNLTSLLFIAFLNQIGNGQTVQHFPHMETKKLDEQTVILPEHTKGKYTLLGLAFSKEAETDLTTWYQPVYETFIFKDKGGAFEVENYDVHLYFIPMFTGINQTAHGKAVKEMKQTVDKTLWPYIALFKGDLKIYKDQLGLDKKELPYFFVLDKKGDVVYKTTGKYSDKKMEEIEKVIGNN